MKTKHFFVTAMLAVVALFFVACTSDDDAAAEGELEQGVVKAEFTISFPQQMGGFTRQGIKVVQGQTPPVFRGIQNIELLPFTLDSTAISGTTLCPSQINLLGGTTGFTGASSSNNNTIASTGALYDTSKSHLYKDIEVPIGTRTFIFYGVAIPEESIPTGVKPNAVNGALTKTAEPATEGALATLGDVTFSPTQIYDDDKVNQQGSDIAEYLTAIANASYTDGDKTETTLTLFPNFKDINTGSWNSVKAAVQQVYSVIYNQQVETGNLQKAIVDAITKQYTFGSGDAARTVQFAKVGSTAGTLDFTTTTYTYPQNIGLPDGAAYVEWQSNKFVALTNDNMGKNIATLNQYVYPASLYYFGFSGIKTAAASMGTHYTSTATWKNILDAYNGETVEGKGSVVSSTTQSIAIKNEVQYAVGRLDVTVNTYNGHTYLEDNSGNLVDNIVAGVSTTTISGSETETETTFPITGIIVANQRPVDYKFEPKGSAYVLYDSQVAENVPCMYPAAKSNYPSDRKTHTLVLQTKDVADNAADAKVKIAVEFLNNSGKTFVGKDGYLIYPKTKFYLIGELDPDKNTSQYYTGTTNLIKKAFVQDYVTTAQFVVKSLQNAYNMLPDMRSPKLEIGMSVDLTWKTGITQEITID